MIKYLPVLLCWSFFTLCKAQTSPDSLFAHAQAELNEGNASKALVYYKQMLDIYQKAKDKKNIANCYRLIGEAFRASGDYASALSNLYQALPIAKDAGDSALVGRIYNRLGAVYYEQNNLDMALTSTEKALKISESSNDSNFIANNLNTLGAIYRNRNDVAKAIENLNRSIEIQKTLKDKSDVPNAMNNLASTYQQAGRFDEAIKMAKESLDLAAQKKTNVYCEYAAMILHECYKALGDYKNAYEYALLYKSYGDEMRKESGAKEIAKVKKELEMDQLTIKNKLNENLIKETNEKNETLGTRNIALIATLVLSLLILVVFFIGRKKLLKNNKLLQEKNVEIENQTREITQIADHLKSANSEKETQRKKLEELNKVKDKLFSIISHDLRSPMNSIQGMLNLLSQKAISEVDFARFAVTLGDRVDYTTMLLDNLLNWSRSQMEGFSVESVPVYFGDVAQSVCNLVTQNATVKNITLENRIEDNPVVLADKNMVELVLRNLISNAIKFTPTGGKIILWSENVEDFELEVMVRDTGTGINKENLTKLFSDEFFSTPGTAAEKGSGLGLRLCREFVQKNGGRIWAESAIGEGSVFHFTLPLKR